MALRRAHGRNLPVLHAEPNGLTVTLLNYNVPLSGLATTSGATNVGKAFDAIKKNATGDLGFVAQQLVGLSDTQLDSALRSLSGEIHASQTRLSTTDAVTITDMIRNTLSERESDAEEAKADAGGQTAAAVRSKPSAYWIQFAADHASLKDGTANVGGGGYDFKQSDNVTAGAGFSFTQGTLSLLGSGGQSAMKAPRAFGYSGFGWGPFRIHGGGSAAKATNHTKRNIQFMATVPNQAGQPVPLTNRANRALTVHDPRLFEDTPSTTQPASDGVDRTAESDQTSINHDQWTEIRDTLKIKTWTIDWKVGLRQMQVIRHAFSETGADSISLEAAGDETTTMRETDLNFHVFKKKGKWRPNFMFSYRREFAPDVTSAEVEFAGRNDSKFESEGLPIPNVEYKALAGITMSSLLGQYTLEYHFSHAKEETHNSLSFKMRFF